MSSRGWLGSLALSCLALCCSGPLSAQASPTGWADPIRVERAGVSTASAPYLARPSERDAGEAARRNRSRGALWGGGIGLVAGGVLGGLFVSSDEDDGFGDSLVEGAATGEAVLLGALVGGALGAVLGATVFAPSHAGAVDADSASGFSVWPIASLRTLGFSVRISR